MNRTAFTATEIIEIGVADEVVGQQLQTITRADHAVPCGLVVVVGATVVDSDDGEIDWEHTADTVEDTLSKLHEHVQRFATVEGNLRSDLRIVFVIDEGAAMGDPARPGESTIASGALVLARTLALEFRRRRGTANVVLTAVHPPGGGPDLRSAIEYLLTAGPETTGQELALNSGGHLGRLRP